MKKTPQAENIDNSAYNFFEATEFGGLVPVNDGVPVAIRPAQKITFLDHFLSIIKWVFLYIPGVAAIHFIMMGFALMFFYGNWSSMLLVGTLGVVTVATFMIMLGVGKLTDLKYLRVVGGVVSASALASIAYSISIMFIPGDFFGRFAQLTLPFILLVGYLVKRNTDRATDDS